MGDGRSLRYEEAPVKCALVKQKNRQVSRGKLRCDFVNFSPVKQVQKRSNPDEISAKEISLGRLGRPQFNSLRSSSTKNSTGQVQISVNYWVKEYLSVIGQNAFDFL